MSYQPRKWQEKAFAIVSHANASDKKEVVLVNACVGSGKTAVASYALGDFIAKNKDKKTFQMFVTPRIKLCSQQVKSVQDDISSMFGYEDGKEYQIVRRDCSVDTSVKFNPKKIQYAKHIILVICDESLWGKDDKCEDDYGKRFQSYMLGFEKLTKDGYVLGNAIFDEAHNYTSCHDKIFGQERA